MKIGIIGAENSHATAIARLINVEKVAPGFTVEYIWGETAQHAQAAAKNGHISNTVPTPSKMLGKIDALIVDHRHPKYHLPAALPFLKEGVPCFIDKPFCHSVAKGKEFLATAKRLKVAVTSFSVIPKQKTFTRFVRNMNSQGDITAGALYGLCDLKSKWGGVFFYGIHQVDAAVQAFGYNVSKVFVTKNGNGATGQLIYSDGKIITLNFITKGCPGFSITGLGTNGTVHQALTGDANKYLVGVKTFTKMFRTGIEPEKHEHILKPIQILEALERSAKSASVEKVSR